jgi:BirA family biotin operon repressor/biotin-[acetyl-CoA-carboxylase] ligase
LKWGRESFKRNWFVTAASIPEEFADALTWARPRLGSLASRTLWFPDVGSTNDIAAALADHGAAEGVLVIADRQTAGRGRLGRAWVSPPGAGIYASVVLRPDPYSASLLTLAAGVAVAEGIGAACGLAVHMKWPNDVHVDGRKLAGILAEGTAGQVVLGIGINVQAARYPPEISGRVTSIEIELGRSVDRGLVLAECLASLSAHYLDLQERKGSRVIDAWRQRAAPMLGRRVEWDAAGERQTGQAQNIDDEGALIVKVGTGSVRITSGEVRWL